ncbi:MAG: 4'-phosphopantetheinyl transferase family protein [Lachnospiraceae bacterium]
MSCQIYVANISSLEKEELFELHLKKMNKDRKNKIKKLKHKKDKMRALAAGIILEKALIEFGCENFEIEYDQNGKPFLPYEDNLHFSLSHSGEYVSCVVSNYLVGIDIQEEKKIHNNIIKRFFHEKEVEYLTYSKENKKDFFRFWAGKESYIKLTGLGMRQELNSFYVDLENQRIHDLKEKEYSIYIKEYFILKGYALTICSYKNEFPDFIKKIWYKL